MKAVATGIGANKTALMDLLNTKPNPIAGIEAIIRFKTKRREMALVVSDEATLRSFSRNSQQTAKIAPNWIMTSKALPLSSLKLSKSPTKIR